MDINIKEKLNDNNPGIYINIQEENTRLHHGTANNRLYFLSRF